VPLHYFFVARVSAWRAPPGLALASPRRVSCFLGALAWASLRA
jgi:hypothetical protein